MFKLLDFSLIVFDFDGVFTDNLVAVDENGKESVTCSRADGLGIAMLRRAISKKNLKINLLVVSTEVNPVVAKRCKKLGIESVQGVDNKKDFLESYLANKSISSWENLLYLGNDLNDLEAMNLCVSFAPKDAHPLVLKAADLVFEERGGHGFVRAAVEYLLEIDKMAPEEISELVLNR
jgi:YrbI family 3-deoxy-D-manno-octulosonate 8-phosphate phosphatase